MKVMIERSEAVAAATRAADGETKQAKRLQRMKKNQKDLKQRSILQSRAVEHLYAALALRQLAANLARISARAIEDSGEIEEERGPGLPEGFRDNDADGDHGCEDLKISINE